MNSRSFTPISSFASNDDSSRTERLLSVKEASAFLGMSDKWLYQSDVPFVRMGRRRLYMISSLIAYARQRLSTARSGSAL